MKPHPRSLRLLWTVPGCRYGVYRVTNGTTADWFFLPAGDASRGPTWRLTRLPSPPGEQPQGRPTTGPAAAILDTLDDVRAALVLLRRAEDRMMRFVRTPISALTMSALTRSRASVANVAKKLERGTPGEN